MINCRIYLHGSEIHELLNLIKFTTHDDHRDEGRLLLRRGGRIEALVRSTQGGRRQVH